LHFLAGGSAGQTPLDPDEARRLIPSWVATHGDRDRAEQENIARAELWTRGRRLRPTVILTERFVRRLHQRMFGEVWQWAGTYRTSNKNIGADYWRIAEEIGQLLGNALYWVENEVYERDELAVRFHHKLVWIHPFPNGNGRLSRMAADLLVEALGGERLNWGAALAAEDPAAARQTYIEALQAADGGDIAPLIAFTRS
jgi:Fic-DOC domain mobile mystery protein B